jgi:hypothetical protein
VVFAASTGRGDSYSEAWYPATHMYTQLSQTDIISAIAMRIGVPLYLLLPVLITIVVATLILKGFGMWYAARNRQKYWFVAMLVINGLGIPELIYLTWFRRDKRPSVTPSLFDSTIDGTVAESPAEMS